MLDGADNLIQDGSGAGLTNSITGDPLLGPLTDNGGTTFTHALSPGSPAINAGDPLAVAEMNGVPEFDQRGTGFPRVVDDRIDIGAVDRQLVGACDFDGDGSCDIDDIDDLVMEIIAETNNMFFDLTFDGLVNLDDRDEWLVLAGAENLLSGNPYLFGDADLDGFVDGQDFIVWNGNKFTSTGKWSQADWNADGVTDGQDFIIWNGNKFQSSNAAAPRVLRQLHAVADKGDVHVNDQTPVQPVGRSQPTAPVAIRQIDAVFAGRRNLTSAPMSSGGRISSILSSRTFPLSLTSCDDAEKRPFFEIAPSSSLVAIAGGCFDLTPVSAVEMSVRLWRRSPVDAGNGNRRTSPMACRRVRRPTSEFRADWR